MMHMALAGLHNADLKLVLFGGKGGVGKTSLAAATAIELAGKHKTLLISTDPAHSVSDSLDQTIGYGIQKISGVKNLAATEIVAEQAYDDFKTAHQKDLKKLLETSTYLDSEDIDDLLRLSIPGIDEVMSFKTIIDLIEESDHEKYVVDMAPSGHALRLMSSPALLDQWIKVAAKMRWKYRYMIHKFSGSYKEDATDTLLVKLKKTVKKIEELFRDNSKCEFIPVCIPEKMAVAETNRLIKSLSDFKIEVKQLIINNTHSSDECSFCRQRKEAQEAYIEEIDKTHAELNRVYVPLFPKEISGLDSLNALREHLFSK